MRAARWRASDIRTSVTVYGADDVDGSVGLWMEFVQGKTLKQIVEERGVLSAREAALIGLDLSRALAAVHRAGLIHRDIKAQNVMREQGGRIVLMDFGTGCRCRRRARAAGGNALVPGAGVVWRRAGHSAK